MTAYRVALGLSALVFFSSSAIAQSLPSPRTVPQAGQVSLMPMAGSDFTLGGDFSKSFSGTATSTGTFTGTASLSLNRTKFSDAYDNPLVAGLSVGYGLDNSGEVFGTARYLHASGRSKQIGNITAAGTLN